MSSNNNTGNVSNLERHPGATFRDRREQLGITRHHLATLAACSLTALQNIETGVTRRGITRDKIASILTDLEQQKAAA